MRVRSHKTLYEGRGLIRGKEYEVLSVENGWYRIISELGEDYLFPPEWFEPVEQEKSLERD